MKHTKCLNKKAFISTGKDFGTTTFDEQQKERQCSLFYFIFHEEEGERALFFLPRCISKMVFLFF